MNCFSYFNSQNRIENILSDQELPHEVALKIVESQKHLYGFQNIKALLYISKMENEQFLKMSRSHCGIKTEVVEELEAAQPEVHHHKAAMGTRFRITEL